MNCPSNRVDNSEFQFEKASGSLCSWSGAAANELLELVAQGEPNGCPSRQWQARIRMPEIAGAGYLLVPQKTGIRHEPTVLLVKQDPYSPIDFGLYQDLELFHRGIFKTPE